MLNYLYFHRLLCIFLQGMWSAALFWADKAHALGGVSGEPHTACAVAASMLRRGEFHRAAYTLTSRGLHKLHLMSYYVAARALIEAKEYQDTLQVLEEVDPENLIHTNNDPPRNVIYLLLLDYLK